jgi:hypothetical protein
VLRALALIGIGLWLWPGVGSAQAGDKYQAEAEPQRIALVIGNSSYPGVGDITSAELDAQRVRERLGSLGFTVLPARNNIRTAREFEDYALTELGKAIEPGALVVVYFSGHGFTYGPHNYLAMTDLKKSVTEKELLKLAVPVESIEVYLADREPGMQVVLVDACRTISGFVIANPQSGLQLKKGADVQPANSIPAISVNTMTGYAAWLGSAAIGSQQSGEMSLFTQSLVRYIGADDGTFSSQFKEVIADVRQASTDEQWPGLADWSSTELYLKPSADVISQEKIAWEAAYTTNSWPDIERFNLRHSLSRHAGAARQWLADHPREMAANYTAISPAAVERAWVSSANGVSIKRSDTGFAFDRNLMENAEFAAALSNTDLGVVAYGSREPASITSDLARELKLLLTHGVVVATKAFDVRGRPDATARITDKVEAGENVRLLDFTESADGSIWARATTPSSLSEIFLPVSKPKPISSVQLGRPLEEVIVPPLANGIADLVQPEPLQATLAALRAQGRTVTWVSVSAMESSDAESNEARQARMVHAQYLLKRGGIDGKRITAILGQGEELGEGVRLRFFGY